MVKTLLLFSRIPYGKVMAFSISKYHSQNVISNNTFQRIQCSLFIQYNKDILKAILKSIYFKNSP